MIRLYCVWAILLPLLCHAQLPLQPGDTIPLHFYDGLPANDSNKLYILDFWATWCTNCLKEIPKDDSLQQQFSGKLQLVLVNAAETGDDSTKLTAFFMRWQRSHAKALSLPSVAMDTFYNASFPHLTIPHYAWIYHNKVVAITGQEVVTAKNIANILRGTPVAFNMKMDNMEFDPAKPLFIHGPRSMISGYQEGLPTRKCMDTDNGLFTRLCFTNTCLAALYAYAFNTLLPKNRIEANDSILSLKYCFEVISNPISKKEVQLMMQQDLQALTGIAGKLVTKQLPCLVLSSKAKFPVDSLQPESNLYGDGRQYKFIHHEPLSTFIYYANSVLPVPLVDETGAGIISLDGLPADITDIPSLRNALSMYGFTLTETTRPIAVLQLQTKTVKQ